MISASGAALREKVLADLGDHIRLVPDPDHLAYAAAATLGRALGVSRAGYGTIDPLAETNRFRHANHVESRFAGQCELDLALPRSIIRGPVSIRAPIE